MAHTPLYWQVLYNLMEWPLQRDSRLAVIGIGNTIDMPERLLPRINRCFTPHPFCPGDGAYVMLHPRIRIA